MLYPVPFKTEYSSVQVPINGAGALKSENLLL